LTLGTLGMSVKHMEEQLTGNIQTDPREQNGAITFGLLVDGNGLIFCTSAEGYRSDMPKIGDRVTITGKRVADVSALGHDPNAFHYTSLTILE
jgi:hypothetical protein